MVLQHPGDAARPFAEVEIDVDVEAEAEGEAGVKHGAVA